MAVYRKAGREMWSYDFVFRGKRYAGPTGVKSTRRAAEAAERLIREKMATGEMGGVGDMTLDEACERYWLEHAQHLNTAASVEKSLATIVRLIGKDTTLGEINQGVVADAVQRRSVETFARGKDRVVAGKRVLATRYPIKPATVNRDIIAPLQSMLGLARTNWNTNPKHGLPDIAWRKLKLKEPKGLSRIYAGDERARWVAAVAADWECGLELGLEMLLTYGLRAGELPFPLDAVNADPAGPTLTLHKTRKADEILHLPLRKDHARQLAARIGMAREAGLNTVWFERDGKKLVALTYDQIVGRLRTSARRAGVRGGRLLHGARHHAASTILATTGNLKAVQSLLGHASIISSARYAHVLIGDLRNALDGEESHPIPTGPTGDKAANEG